MGNGSTFKRIVRHLVGEHAHRLRIVHLVSLLCVTALSGCVSLPPGTSLKSGERAGSSMPRKAWVASVKVTDPAVTNQRVVEDSLRANIAVFLQESVYFSVTSTLPGKVNPEDLVLDFRFPRFWQERSVHPAYFPAALITLTFYIWFGGPVAVDEYELSGVLMVKDGTGKLLAESSTQVQERQNVSIYNDAAILPSGLAARTSVVQELVMKSIRVLRNSVKP